MPNRDFSLEPKEIYPLLLMVAEVYTKKDSLTETDGNNRITAGPVFRLVGVSAIQLTQQYGMYGPDPTKFGPAIVEHITREFHPAEEEDELRNTLNKVVKDELAKLGSAVETTTEQKIQDCETLIQFATPCQRKF